LKYLFKFFCLFEQIFIKIITFINKHKSNNITRTRSNFDFAKINQNILFTRSLFYNKINKSLKQKLLSNIKYYKSELDFDEETKFDCNSNDLKKLFKMPIEIEKNSLFSNTNSKLLQESNRRFTIELFAQTKQEEFTLFNIFLNKSIKHLVFNSKIFVKFVNKYLKT